MMANSTVLDEYERCQASVTDRRFIISAANSHVVEITRNSHQGT